MRLHSRGLSQLGTDFARLIVRRPCSKDGVEVMSFLKEERGTWLRKRWKFVLVCSLLVGFFSVVSCAEQIVGKKLTAFLALDVPDGDSCN